MTTTTKTVRVLGVPAVNDVPKWDGSNYVPGAGGGGGGASGVGLYSARPAAGNVGARYATTDGPIEWVDDGAAWRPDIAGVLGKQPPAAAGFTTVFTSGRATTFVDDAGGLLVDAFSNLGGTDFRVFKKALAAETVVTLHGRPLYGIGESYPCYGIAYRNSVTGQLDALALYADNDAGDQGVVGVQRQTMTASDATSAPAAFVTVASNSFGFSPNGGSDVWLRTTFSTAGNIKTFEISRDGRVWRTLLTVPIADQFTPDEVGFFIGKLAGAGTNEMTLIVDSYEAAAPVVPSVASIAPNTGPAAGGTPVTITGFGFARATGATIGGVALAGLIVVSDNRITGTTPAHAAGATDVIVTTPAGASPPLVGGFTYV